MKRTVLAPILRRRTILQSRKLIAHSVSLMRSLYNSFSLCCIWSFSVSAYSAMYWFAMLSLAKRTCTVLPTFSFWIWLFRTFWCACLPCHLPLFNLLLVNTKRFLKKCISSHPKVSRYSKFLNVNTIPYRKMVVWWSIVHTFSLQSRSINLHFDNDSDYNCFG